MASGLIMQAEMSFLGILQTVRCPALDFFFKYITFLGEIGIFWLVICIVLLCIEKHRSTGIKMALSLIITFIICNLILKNCFMRLRPYQIEGALLTSRDLLINPPVDTSFPSGHTAASFTGAWSIYRNTGKKSGIPALIVAALIALSRLYLYVHFPSDVLAGGVIGIITAEIISRKTKRLFKK